MRRTRVAVLGGGCGGVAAAWALSRTPELRRRFEVTLVQPGWRLGGKGTTGRHPVHGARIEEHGLHVWMGFYRHAFGMVADYYQHWDPPVDHPLPTVEDAFTPHHTVTLCDAHGHPRHLRLPPRPGRPWDAAPHRRTFVRDWLRWARRELPAALADWTGPGSGRQARDLLRLVAVITRGLVRDGGLHAASLDDEDLCAWLRRHGTDDPAVYDAPPVRAFYNLAFAYPDGEAAFGRGALAAGPALRSMARMLLTYRGAPFWKMRAGMGDTVFAPAWRVLRQRGVRVALFHRVEQVHTDGHQVTAVDIGVQAEESAPGAYDPLERVHGLWVWPDRPRREGLEQLVAGDLEAGAGPCLRTERWVAGDDFDAVVLGVPVPAHRRIASQLMAASPRYRAMVDHSASVATVAAQLWFRRSLSEIGWPGPSTVSTNGPGLFASWADMTETVDAEAWPRRPGLCAYFVDVAPDAWFEGLDRAGACAEVRRRARGWADDDLVRLFPGAADAEGRLDRSALVHGPLAPGEDALDAQYFRANTEAWERYVLTPPGSVKYRLPPEDSGFSNLFLAGDWTRTSIDGGSVEAAVESGQRAGEAVVARLG